MGMGTAIMRLVLFVTNFFMTLFALAMIAIGSWILVQHDELQAIFDDGATTVGVCTLGVGLLLIILGITGLCGACVQGTKMCIIMHMVLLAILLIVALAGSVVMFYYSAEDEYEEKLKDDIAKSYKRYGDENSASATVTDSIDFVQNHLGCCGRDNYTDWSNATVCTTWAVALKNSHYYPDSCCHHSVYETGCGKKSGIKIYEEGCEHKIARYLDQWLHAIAGALIGVFILEVICFIFSCCLACGKKK